MTLVEQATAVVSRARESNDAPDVALDLILMLNALDLALVSALRSTHEAAEALPTGTAQPAMRFPVPVQALDRVVERAMDVLPRADSAAGLPLLQTLRRIGNEAQRVDDAMGRALELVELLVDNEILRQEVRLAAAARRELRDLEMDAAQSVKG